MSDQQLYEEAKKASPGCNCASFGLVDPTRHGYGCPYGQEAAREAAESRPPRPEPDERLLRQQRDEYKREAERFHTALREARKLINRVLDEENFS